MNLSFCLLCLREKYNDVKMFQTPFVRRSTNNMFKFLLVGRHLLRVT